MREPVQRFQPKRMVVCVEQGLKLLPSLVVTAVLIAFGSRFFDGAFHALHLAIRPWIVGLGLAVFNVVLASDLIETLNPVTGCSQSGLRRKNHKNQLKDDPGLLQ